jgi:catechol 2,3-dioxygenase-like lactoylglutathione lyase family enzyme
MSIKPETPGVHHVGLRVSDIARARRFYTEILGFPVLLDRPDVFLFRAGGTAIGIRGPAADTPTGDSFNSSRVGLDHVALGCADEGELNRVAAALQAAGVENTGVKLDEALGKRYVAFKDPDRIAWEFYST